MARLDAKKKLLDSALGEFRARGYAATTVDDLCRAAGVTKGAFFHHFASKEALAVAAAGHWLATTGELFETASYHAPQRPLDRVLAYIDFRRQLIAGEIADFTCLAGTLVQEVYASHPAIREACARAILGHAETLEADIQAAIDEAGLAPGWTAASLALHTQVVLQGAFVVTKATGDPQMAVESVDHLRRYVEALFGATVCGRETRN